MDNKLSIRLKYIASLVSHDMIIGDIGSDHGYLPYYLLKNNIVSFIYASDNKIGPFNNLSSTLKEFEGKCEVNLKDGLDDLPSYVNTLSITGMGGDLIISILEKGKNHLSHIENMILSPQQNVEGVRRYLNSIGYKIVKERIVFDEKYYNVLLCKKGEEKLSDIEYKYGKYLLDNKDETFINYLMSQRQYYLRILALETIDETKRTLLNNNIDEIDDILGDYYGF